MPPKITLTVTQGENEGQQYTFDQRVTCIMGRAKDCLPGVPNNQAHRRISRYHCLLDVNPPDIRVRDFGSLNGTFVNDKMIGRRKKGLAAEEARRAESPEYDLKDGDEIKLGTTKFRVEIYVPRPCCDCGAEIEKDKQAAARVEPGVFRCKVCRGSRSTDALRVPMGLRERHCARCGKNLADQADLQRRGEFVCADCKADPFQILQSLVDLASTDRKDLAAIEGYSIVRTLGKGGMGAVSLARHERTQRLVALKVMLPEVAAERHARDLFLREISYTKQLDHPNVVELLESGCSGGTFFFTMEYCSGGSLRDMLRMLGGKLAVAEAVDITLQALDGLQYAHTLEIDDIRLADGSLGKGRGLVHRDLNPANIFLHSTGDQRIVKVGDYGLAKAFDTAGLSGQTRTGATCGKPTFMPRQQVINYRYARPDVDVWAMAATLYFMLTGQYPRDFVKGKDVWQIVLGTSPTPIRQRVDSISKPLAEVIDGALDDRRDLHFTSAADLKSALSGAL